MLNVCERMGLILAAVSSALVAGLKIGQNAPSSNSVTALATGICAFPSLSCNQTLLEQAILLEQGCERSIFISTLKSSRPFVFAEHYLTMIIKLIGLNNYPVLLNKFEQFFDCMGDVLTRSLPFLGILWKPALSAYEEEPGALLIVLLGLLTYFCPYFRRIIGYFTNLMDRYVDILGSLLLNSLTLFIRTLSVGPGFVCGFFEKRTIICTGPTMLSREFMKLCRRTGLDIAKLVSSLINKLQ